MFADVRVPADSLNESFTLKVGLMVPEALYDSNLCQRPL